MPDIDPSELLSRLQKLPQQASPPPDREKLWERLQGSASPEKQSEEKTSAGAGLWEGLKRGAMDVLESGAEIGAKMMRAGPEAGAGAFDNPAQRQAMAARVAPAIAQSNQAYGQNPAVQQHPIASALGRVGGNVAASAPLMGVPGASGAGMGMAGRALMGAGMGGATGGLPGAVAGAGLGAAGAALGPPASQAMLAIAQKFPNLAGMATGAMGRSEEAFQRATANEVLQPLREIPKSAAAKPMSVAGRPEIEPNPGGGFDVHTNSPAGVLYAGSRQEAERLAQRHGLYGGVPANENASAPLDLSALGAPVPPSVKVGHSLINEVGERLNAAYNKLLPKVTFRPADANPATGKSFNDALTEIKDKVPEAFGNDFTKLVKRVIEKPVEKGGGLLPGKAFKDAQSEIGLEARQFTKWTASPNEEKYADILHDLQSAMRESLRAHNPTEAPMLEKVDQAWARYVRLQDAAGRRVQGQGEFTPIDLLNAAKRGEGNRAFSDGNRLMQGFGTAGLNLVQGKPTNLQKVLMDVAGAGVGGAVGSALGGPAGAAVGGAAGGAAAHLALPAMRGLGRATRTDTLQELGKATSRTAPVAGAGEDRREPYVSPSGL